MKGYLVLLVIAMAMVPGLAYAPAERGVITLDDLTFHKVVDGSKDVLVRFDKEYAHGEAVDHYRHLAKRIAETGSELLVATYPIIQHGDEKDVSHSLPADYGITKDEQLPAYLLFRKGGSLDEPLKYTGAYRVDDMLSWLSSTGGYFFGLPGQLKDFNEFAKEFITSADKRQSILDSAQGQIGSLTSYSKDSAMYYIEAMQNIAQHGMDWVKKERDETMKLVADKTIGAKRRRQLQHRLNVLSSFIADKTGIESLKTEL